MSALLIDIGNSRLKWGVLDRDEIRRTGHIAMNGIRDTGLSALTSKLPLPTLPEASVAVQLTGVRPKPNWEPAAGEQRLVDLLAARTEVAAEEVAEGLRAQLGRRPEHLRE